MRPIVVLLPVALLLAGCGRGDDAREASPGNFIPPVTRAPTPLPGQRQTTPLSSYVGHYPADAVDGVAFWDRSEVAGLLSETVPDEARRRVVVGHEATTTPIARIGSRIAAHGCEAHDCGDRNWTVLVAADGDRDRGTVCFHDTATMGNASAWSTRAGTEQRAGECPQG